MANLLGLHYFQDSDHYLVKDLNHWLPELINKGIKWLVLQNPRNRAISEEFLSNLIDNSIQPIIQINRKVDTFNDPEELKVILEAYSKWGVKYVIFFDQPNMRESWINDAWNKGDIVEQFLDTYIPLQKIANQAGLTSIFPPLQPGGDYWDTAFLKKVLKSATDRKCLDLITDFHIAVSSQTFNQSLDLDDGEIPAIQKSAYDLSGDVTGHMCFRASEYYTKIIQSFLGYEPKVFLFWYGSSVINPLLSQDKHFSEMIQLTSKDSDFSNLRPLAGNVLACMVYSISALSSISAFQIKPHSKIAFQNQSIKIDENLIQNQNLIDDLSYNLPSWVFSIDHYLLLPEFKHGIPEYILEKIRPIIQSDQPTIGFSLDEASLARKVTIWNENQAFTDTQIDFLRRAGCQIEEKVVNGLEIALD